MVLLKGCASISTSLTQHRLKNQEMTSAFNLASVKCDTPRDPEGRENIEAVDILAHNAS